jgi:hypothetical protein
MMDSACHVINRIMNARFLKSTMDSARNIISRILDPHLLSQTASYDVASTIH